MSNEQGIDPEAIATLDPGGMGNLIAGMGDHMMDALSIAEDALDSFSLPTRSEVTNIVVGGMGGSAIAGDLVCTYLRDKLPLTMHTVRAYSLPHYIGPSSMVVVSSYSGNTAEALELYKGAVARNAMVLCITSGGKLAELAKAASLPTVIVPGGWQPRAALAYSFVPLLALVGRVSDIEDQSDEVKSVAQHLKQLAKLYSPAAPESTNTAVKSAASLIDKVPIVYSADVLDSVNYRWRGQLQENAKHLVYGNVLPELAHNEISGWEHPHDVLSRFSTIFLRSKGDEHPEISRKVEAVKRILGDKGVEIQEHHAIGSTRLNRMFSLISLADWTSYYLGLLTGIDPTPIPAIEAFKKAMST